MADSGDSPRSKLDFLYRDVLGEVASLVERLEAVSAELGDVAKARAGQATAEALVRAAGASAGKVRTELERSAEIACRRLGLAVDEAASAASRFQGARRRDYVIWGAAYLGASLLGGAVAALLLRIP
jgi:hypothetical protein